MTHGTASRLWHLIALSRCRVHVALLIFISLAEVLTVSRMGKVAGSFYMALVDANWQKFESAVVNSALWYVVTAVISALHEWSAELLTIQWRESLTQVCHTAYFKKGVAYRITPGNLNSHPASLDNPDQRITQEILNLSVQLSAFVSRTVTAPLMIAYYTYEVNEYVGLDGCAAIYGFFFLGSIVSRQIVAPIANLVVEQERREANFRFSHVRVRNNAEVIALAGSEATEQTHLDADLARVVANQKRLLTRHLYLNLFTKIYDYSGSMMNYLVLAVPVFGGAFSESSDKGEVAKLISNASFAVLQLVYSFTQLIDTSRILSDIVGYTTRVGELFEALGILNVPRSSDLEKRTKKSLLPLLHRLFLSFRVNPKVIDEDEITRPLLGSHEISCSEVGSKKIPPNMVRAPTKVLLPGGTFLEYSIHTVPPELAPSLSELFPEASIDSIYIVPTFQVAGIDICSLSETSQEGSVADLEVGKSRRVFDEMDRLLGSFLIWQASVSRVLRSKNFWSNAIDPRSGHPLVGDTLGDTGPRFSEVFSARVLLGYPTEMAGPCPVLSHPLIGRNSYPATFFTNAPPAVFVDAVTAVETRSQSESLLAFRVENFGCSLPGGGPTIVKDLDFGVRQGDGLLVQGRSGAGKTSFLRCLFGLWQPWPSSVVTMSVPGSWKGKDFIFLPQRAAFSGGGLAAQIVYPNFFQLSDLDDVKQRLHSALRAVEMEHLLERVDYNWLERIEWEMELSAGEQQRLALARIFYHVPFLAVFDEATSSVGVDMEDKIYGQLKDLGISYISVSHGIHTRKWHKKTLLLSGDGMGSWTIQEEWVKESNQFVL